MFNLGDTVLCIDSSFTPDKKEYIEEVYLHWVQKDKEYTVRAIFDNNGIVEGMLLEELHNYEVSIPLLGGAMREPAFGLHRFRKLASAPFKWESEVREGVEEEILT